MTGIGQHMDMEDDSFDTISLERFEKIATHKTAIYTFYMPTMLAFHLSNFHLDDVLHKTIKDICVEVGVLYQINDDFLDVYNPTPDKTPRDIEDGRCTWLIAAAKLLADYDQLTILQKNYGREHGRQAVVDVYNKIGMKHIFCTEIIRRRDICMNSIRNLPVGREVFTSILEKVCQSVVPV